MPKLALGSNVVSFENQLPADDVSLEELLSGLKQKQKKINPKYFYDTHGSELFEKITQLPEYYPTRVERRILEQNATDIASHCGKSAVVVEPGSGSSEKIRLLLDSLDPRAYVPMDIAADFLQASADKLGDEFPWLSIHAICADFNCLNELPNSIPEGERLIFYPGSTIGNMEPEKARAFLANVHSWLTPTDRGLLIGIDLHKSKQRLEDAYNDEQGVTAAFNVNVLNHVNRLVDGSFDTKTFRHKAFYDEKRKRIEMHLVSNVEQSVNLGDSRISFAKGETIHTESSYKYTLESFSELSNSAGFTVEHTWLDDERLYSLHFLKVQK